MTVVVPITRTSPAACVRLVLASLSGRTTIDAAYAALMQRVQAEAERALSEFEAIAAATQGRIDEAARADGMGRINATFKDGADVLKDEEPERLRTCRWFISGIRLSRRTRPAGNRCDLTGSPSSATRGRGMSAI